MTDPVSLTAAAGTMQQSLEVLRQMMSQSTRKAGRSLLERLRSLFQ